MMIRKAYSILSIVLLFTAFVTAADIEDFENSLVQEGGNDSYAVSQDSSFEQSLVNEDGYGLSNVYRAREALMQAIKNKDTSEIAQKISELDNMKSDGVVPLLSVEKEIIYLDNKMWNHLLRLEVEIFKAIYDSVQVEEGRKADNDELMIYVNKVFKNIDTNTTLYSNYSNQIGNAQLDESVEMELEIMLLLHNAYTKDGYLRIAELSQQFCEKYPDHPDVPWIKKSVAAPAQRMDVNEMYYAERAERKEEFIARNFYTGGFGVNVFFIPGGLVFGLDDMYRSDLFEPQDPGVYLELYLQVKRFALNGEILGSGITGLASYSLGLGYVIYDSRYLKVRPYAAVGMPTMYLDVIDDTKGPKHGDAQVTTLRKGDTELISDGLTVTLAVNVDYKFLTTYLFTSNNKFFSMSLVGKFGASYIDAEGYAVEGSGVSPFFNLGLGVSFW